MDALVRSHISASHDLHSGLPGFVGARGSLEDIARSGEGFRSSAEVSVGGVSVGVTVSEDEPLGIFAILCTQDCLGLFWSLCDCTKLDLS